MSASSPIRWSARAASEGSPARRKQGRPPGKGPLVAHLDYLIAAVEAAPDITMAEVVEILRKNELRFSVTEVPVPSNEERTRKFLNA